jgi:hypothetical protein
MSHPFTHSPNAIITVSANATFHTTLAHDTTSNMIAFYHVSCYFPALSTWCTTIDAGHFATWPGLASAALRKYPPAFVAMHQGHLEQERVNVITTQSRSPLLPTIAPPGENTQQQATDAKAAFDGASPDPASRRMRHLYIDLNAMNDMIYTDPTGKILAPSVSRHQYMLVVYEYDGNYIHSQHLIDHKGPYIIAAYKNPIQYFESREFKLLLQQLDNEASLDLQSFMDKAGI